MSEGLIRKELRGQWPFLFLGIALLVLEVIEIFREQWDLGGPVCDRVRRRNRAADA
jgi:hypothetical protein